MSQINTGNLGDAAGAGRYVSVGAYTSSSMRLSTTNSAAGLADFDVVVVSINR